MTLPALAWHMFICMSNTVLSRMSHDSYFRMGYFYQASGDLQSAAECYLKSIQNNPSAVAHTFLAWVLNQMGEIDEAISECKKALKLDPTLGNALNDIGVYLSERNQFNKAIAYLNKACRSKNYDSPEFPHYNLARIYVQKDMMLMAVKELKKAVKINPAFSQASEMLTHLEKQIH